jgi:uncharacterized protein YprB with RNaseH-like and TPR domain
MRLENSFVGAHGVGEKTERSLWERGIAHWDDVEDGAVGGKRGETLRAFVERARPRLAEGDADFFADALPGSDRWRLAGNFRESACFFDIETTGLSQRSSVVTTVSCHRGGDTTTLVRGEDLTRERLRAELDAADLLVSYNGKRFDVPFLEAAFDLDVTTPHLDLMYPCRRLDLTGGLKEVERAVGLDRESDVDGREAVRLWHRYESGDEAALGRLVHYNRLDAENLATVLDEVTDRLRREVFEPYVVPDK